MKTFLSQIICWSGVGRFKWIFLIILPPLEWLVASYVKNFIMYLTFVKAWRKPDQRMVCQPTHVRGRGNPLWIQFIRLQHRIVAVLSQRCGKLNETWWQPSNPSIYYTRYEMSNDSPQNILLNAYRVIHRSPRTRASIYICW